MPDISYWAAEDWLYQVLAPSHILYLASRAAAGASGWKDVAQTLLERADCREGVTFITGLESREKDSTDQQLWAWKLQGDKRQHTGLAALNSTTAAAARAWRGFVWV